MEPTQFFLQLFEQQQAQIEALRAQLQTQTERNPKYLTLTEPELMHMHTMLKQLPEEDPLTTIVANETEGEEIDLRSANLELLNMLYRELLKQQVSVKTGELEKKLNYERWKNQNLIQERGKIELKHDELAVQYDRLAKASEAAKIRLAELTPLVEQNTLMQKFMKNAEDSMNAVIDDMDERLKKIRSMIQEITDTAYQVDLQELQLKHVAPRIVGIIKQEDHWAALRNIVGRGQLFKASASGINLAGKK